jgi:hypothetical protein
MKFKTPAVNSRFAKAGVWCFYESEVLNSSFVHLMKFSAENPRLRKAAKRYLQLLRLRLKRNIAQPLNIKKVQSLLLNHPASY